MSSNIVKKVRDWMKKYDNDGREICDPKPLSRTVKLKQETIEEKIMRLVRERDIQFALHSQGVETFDEADDFDIPDDPVDPSTPYETVFEPSLGKEVTRAEAQFLNQQRSAFIEEKPAPKVERKAVEDRTEMLSSNAVNQSTPSKEGSRSRAE